MLQQTQLSMPEELKQHFEFLESTCIHAGMSAFNEELV